MTDLLTEAERDALGKALYARHTVNLAGQPVWENLPDHRKKPWRLDADEAASMCFFAFGWQRPVKVTVLELARSRAGKRAG